MNMRTKTLISLVLMEIVCANGHATGAGGILKWPLRNGDFSNTQGRGSPTGWETAQNSGRHTFRMDPPAPFWNQPSSAIIETTEDGSAYYYQYAELMAGDYTLTVDFRGTDGAKADAVLTSGTHIFSSGLTNVGAEWNFLQFDASVPAGKATVSLAAESTAGQQVSFRNVVLFIERLRSSPVPLSDGSQIGAIVLPETATLAEQFAGYEIQRYLFEMTGLAPGLKDRDEVFAGKSIYIGRAAGDLESIRELAADSYVVHSQGDRISLAGNTDAGTLYAVYDFLRTQGCRWVTPGAIGEIVPKRASLVPPASKTESPDYQCRGIMQLTQNFFPGGGEEFGWMGMNLDDYFDWLLRNRMNGAWFAATESYDFGPHRGHGWVQMLNHSYGGPVAPRQEYFEKHPDWYPLIRGKREAMCKLPPGFCNQLCVSNPGLRDYTVELVLEYFRKNPAAKAFPLNPMDGPSLWCECAACKKLDPPGIDWSKHESEGSVAGMTDRALNYANEVAERVAKVYPDKFIEMYAYGYTLKPPQREKVHKNVFIKYANLGNRGSGPLGLSLMEPNESTIGAAPEPYRWADWRAQLEGWRKAGATMAYYNYLEFAHPDLTVFWFFSNSDVLRNLNRHYNCRILMGETENNVMISSVLYNIIAQTVWDIDTDYKAVMKDTCDAFYGPVSEDLLAYNRMMDEAVIQSTAYRNEDYRPWDHVDIPLETLERGRIMLEEAAIKSEDDPTLSKRVAYAWFGHGYLTYVAALSVKEKTTATRDIARRAFDSANALRLEHDIMIKLPSVRQLKTFYFPPIVDPASAVLELPETWEFRKDPADVGLEEDWPNQGVDASWDKIKVTADWTSQAPGADYHGAAWYRVSFTLPPDAAGKPLAFIFGAIDGVADIFMDGKKIGEQKAPAGTMWDKSFEISLPAEVDVAQSHELVVRVEKKAYAAGIWKPVRIGLKGE